jgi:hypothetical protein
VGIGTSTLNGRLNITGFPGTTSLQINAGGTLSGTRRNWGISAEKYVAGGLTVEIGASEGANPSTAVATFTSGGSLSVGTTINIAKIGAVFDGNTENGCILRTSTNSGGAGFLYFQQDTTTCGVVSRVGTTSAVTYGTTSDYRLKENITPMTGALSKVARLKPVTYTWKSGGESAEGFIAHELAEVCPDAVVGTKDATRQEQYEVTPAVKNEQGNITTLAVMGTRTVPKYQSVDASFLVATLTAAIQELKAINDTQAATITALTARIVALETI